MSDEQTRRRVLRTGIGLGSLTLVSVLAVARPARTTERTAKRTMEAKRMSMAKKMKMAKTARMPRKSRLTAVRNCAV
jgi:hypothetical protein